VSSELLTNDVWSAITRVARQSKSASHVAVAYLGTGASKMLPLKAGSRLVVDASQRAVKSGLTNPFELMKFYKRGVRIYSHGGLHAKIFVISGTAFVGSANVSHNSKVALTEAVIASDARSVVSAARAFVGQLASVEMGSDEIRELQKVYVAPRNSALNKRRRRKTAGLRIVLLDEPEDVPDSIVDRVEEGERTARKMVPARHESTYVWNDFGVSYRDGERLLFVEGEYMWSPATVLFSQRTKGIVVTHIEKSTQRDKKLGSIKGRLSKKTFKRLSRQGILSEAATQELLALWD